MWVPAGLCGACPGSLKYTFLVSLFLRSRADQAHGYLQKLYQVYVLLFYALLLSASICYEYHTSPQQMCTLTQPQYSSSCAPRFSLFDRMNPVFYGVRVCVSSKDSTASSRCYEHKVRLSFLLLGFGCAVCCCSVCITPCSKLCTLWQPWCNSSRLSSYTYIYIYIPLLWLPRTFFFCVCVSVLISVPSRTQSGRLQPTLPLNFKSTRAVRRRSNSNGATSSERHIGPYTYHTYERTPVSPLFSLPHSWDSKPTTSPGGNLAY